jgi:hypothetical protein
MLTYKIHCNTENQDKFWYLPVGSSPPHACPTNTAHSVDLNSVIEIDGGTAMNVITATEQTDKDLKLARGVQEVGSNNTATISIKIPGTFGSSDGRYVKGGYAITEDYNKDDYVTVTVQDTDRIVALLVAQSQNPAATTPLSDMAMQALGAIPGFGTFPNYPEIKAYIDEELPTANQGWYPWPLAQGNSLPPVGKIDLEPLGGYGFLPAGLYIQIIYHRPSGINTGGIRVNFWWGKKE